MATILLGAGGVAACSAALTTGDAACAALTTCCSSIPGQTASSCQQVAQAAKSSGTSCQSVLASYQAGGYCGGGGSEAGVPGTGFDGGALPCEATGTCDGGGNTGTSTACVALGSCPNGESYQTCSQTRSDGVCTAAVVFSDGAKMACTSCSDCSSASASALQRCYAPPPTDAAPPPVDSGPVCGTTPVLHPELVPGVYCPFTATGAVHCLAGEQCCEAPPGQVSSCAPAGTTCPIASSIAWECLDPLDCQVSDAAGPVCCSAGLTTFDSACGFYRGSGFSGSRCGTSCAAGEIQICSAANNPCSSPKQCTPFKVAGVVIGTCL